MATYVVSESRCHTFTYEVEADSPEEAQRLVEQGDVESIDEQPEGSTWFVELDEPAVESVEG